LTSCGPSAAPSARSATDPDATSTPSSSSTTRVSTERDSAAPAAAGAQPCPQGCMAQHLYDVVGVLPLVVRQVIRSLAAKLFKIALPTLKPTLGLSHLDGLTVWHESRLEEEDIENVANMATADIVDLISTRGFRLDGSGTGSTRQRRIRPSTAKQCEGPPIHPGHSQPAALLGCRGPMQRQPADDLTWPRRGTSARSGGVPDCHRGRGPHQRCAHAYPSTGDIWWSRPARA
jgi:hypothetical protein